MDPPPTLRGRDDLAPLLTPLFIIDPPGDPQANMTRDEELATAVRNGTNPATLRIYRWCQPALSIGRRQNPDDLPSSLLAIGLPIVRRPTGGGAVVHRLDELTYALALARSFLIPTRFPLNLTFSPKGGEGEVEGRGKRVRGLNRLPGILHQHLREELIHQGLVSPEELVVVSNVLEGPNTNGGSRVPTVRAEPFDSVRSEQGRSANVAQDRLAPEGERPAQGERRCHAIKWVSYSSPCFNSPICGDLLYRGKKVAGAALRVWRDGLLVQGSIQGLPIGQDDLIEVFLQVVSFLEGDGNIKGRTSVLPLKHRQASEP